MSQPCAKGELRYIKIAHIEEYVMNVHAYTMHNNEISRKLLSKCYTSTWKREREREGGREGGRERGKGRGRGRGRGKDREGGKEGGREKYNMGLLAAEKMCRVNPHT